LLDFAAEVGAPMVGCHGAVGRIRPVTTYEQEVVNYVVGVQRIAERAQELGLELAIEVLNRYESHLLNTAEEAVRFVEEVGAPNVGLLLDTYHMNIEEAGLGNAIRAAGGHLALFHAADSNRQAVGRGHTDFAGAMCTLKDIGYNGSIIVECTASGPDPFTPVKGQGWLEEVGRYVEESIRLLRHYEEIARRGND
jgi:sugar phosphate isomerase/epimerase